jgi:hypothetical protein
LVKEVRVQSKTRAEVWYAFPRPRTEEGVFVDSQIWLRVLVSVRTSIGRLNMPQDAGFAAVDA